MEMDDDEENEVQEDDEEQEDDFLRNNPADVVEEAQVEDDLFERQNQRNRSKNKRKRCSHADHGRNRKKCSQACTTCKSPVCTDHSVCVRTSC